MTMNPLSTAQLPKEGHMPSFDGATVWLNSPPLTPEPRMYQLIRQPEPFADREFEIEFLDAGVEAFAFTFG